MWQVEEELISQINRHAAKTYHKQAFKHSKSNNNEIFHDVTQATKTMSLQLLGDIKEAHSEQVGQDRPTERSVNFKLVDLTAQSLSNGAGLSDSLHCTFGIA